MRRTTGTIPNADRTANRFGSSDAPAPRQTVGGLVVALLAPLVAIAALAAPDLVAVAALSAAATVLASTWWAHRRAD